MFSECTCGHPITVHSADENHYGRCLRCKCERFSDAGEAREEQLNARVAQLEEALKPFSDAHQIWSDAGGPAKMAAGIPDENIVPFAKAHAALSTSPSDWLAGQREAAASKALLWAADAGNETASRCCTTIGRSVIADFSKKLRAQAERPEEVLK